MFVPVIKHLINTSLQKENYLSDDCGWLPWLCGNHVTMTTITFKKKTKKPTHTLLGWSYRHHPAAECPSSVCGRLISGEEHAGYAVMSQDKSTRDPYVCSNAQRHACHEEADWAAVRGSEREREQAGRPNTAERHAGKPTKREGEGRGGEADRVSPLTVWHSWMWDGNPRQTDSWGQTAALSLWPQQPTELKTRCCSSTNVHQRPPKCVSVKKSNFTAEISMSLCQKNRSTHLTAFKCLTWSILNKNLSFPGCRNRQITEKNKTQNGVPQGSITDPLLIIQIISSCLFASTNVQRVFFFKICHVLKLW